MFKGRHHCPEMLISTDELAAKIEDDSDDDLVVVDCRFDLLKPDAGKAAWWQEHIPGAFYADLDRDLAGPITAESGRHPLPDAEAFGALLGSWGIKPETLVVAYDASGGAIAARLWWLLRWVGHTRVALLDGGFAEWADEKLPLTKVDPVLQVGRYPVNPGAMPVVTAAEVALGLESGRFMVFDARDARRFAGKVEPIDTRAGHIPGTINRPFQTNLDALGHFRATADLQQSFRALPVDESQELVCMCGSGVTACHNLFAMELAGITQSKGVPPALYAGSWSEWIRSDDRPVGKES